MEEKKEKERTKKEKKNMRKRKKKKKYDCDQLSLQDDSQHIQVGDCANNIMKSFEWKARAPLPHHLSDEKRKGSSLYRTLVSMIGVR